MANPSAQEQLQLELINRLRTDPGGEYDRLVGQQSNIEAANTYFGVDLPTLEAQLSALSAVPVLAWNSRIENAASLHSGRMIRDDEQSHRLPGEAVLGDRLESAGYQNRQTWGENVYAYSDGPLHGHAGFVIDWGYDDADYDGGGTLRPNWQSIGDGIQDAAGHRKNMMSSAFTEVGIDVTRETNPDTRVGDYVMTQNFATSFDYAAQFVGVVIDDADGDGFYDIGEGMGGVSVSLTNGVDTYDTVSWASGGWQVEAAAGTYAVTFSGGGLAGEITRTATIGDTNVKIDVEAGDAGPAGADADEALAVARLYGGAFGRQPDEAGVNYWIDRAEEGQSRLEAAAFFLDSIEFTETFGNDDAMTNERFVDTMYLNVLDRDQDPGGFDYWVGQMNDGLSREDTLVVFADSPENIARSDYLNSFQEVSDGTWSFV